MPLRSSSNGPSRRPLTHRSGARGLRRLVGRICELRRDATGNLTIEFAFVILIMVTLAIGAFDFGRLGLRKIAVTQAARAGAQYGAQDLSTAEDEPGMVQAARNDIGDANDELQITARNYYFCPNQGEVADETVVCNDGSFSYLYVEVIVPDEVDLLFPYPGIESPRQIASANTMRVR